MSEVFCAHTEMVNIEKVIPNPRNPNKHPDKQISMLAKIIDAQGWRAPITVSKRSGFIVRGHGRLMAAQKLGLEHVPVDYQEYENEAAEWADLIADNRLSELSETDDLLMKDLLSEISGNLDVELTAYTADEVEAMLNPAADAIEDDFDVAGAVAGIETPNTQPGDIYLLGNHRLMCGDTTVAADTQCLLGGGISDMVFTDPPYNVDYTGGTGLKIINDKMSDSKFYQFLFDAYKSMIDAVTPGGAIYVCHADSEGLNFRKALIDAGWLLKQCIVWVKSSLVMGRQDYQWKHEPILYGWKPGAAHRWNGGRKQTTVVDGTAGVTVRPDADGFVLSFESGLQSAIVKVPSYEVVYSGADDGTTVWRIEKPLNNGEHPTMKPIALCSRAITNSSKPGGSVLDPFGGSGSTLIACEQLSRRCYMMEMDPKYCDVIVKRWETLTGKKAEKISR